MMASMTLRFRCDFLMAFGRVLKNCVVCRLLKRSQRRGAFLVIVSVKRDREIRTSTNTSHEHEFKSGD
jgi:hypothetical protein